MVIPKGIRLIFIYVLINIMEVDALFKVKVKTNAKSFRLRVKGLILFVDITSAPQEGEANREVIKELKKLFKRPVVMVKGHKNKEKIVLVRNLMPEDAKRILDKCERFEEPASE